MKVPAATTTLETQSIDASTVDITKEVSAKVEVSLPWVKGMLSMDGSCCLRMSFVNISFYSSVII